MLRILFIKEIREAMASRRFWVILALCLVLIPLGVEVSLKDYQTRLQNYREAVRIYQEQTKTASDVVYKGGAKAFAPPSPLGFLSLGLELVNPNVAETQYKFAEPPAVMRLGNNQGRDNLYEFFYGPLDLIFVVGVVMSLLAVVMSYGAIAGEKEQGTLGLVLSNPLPRAKLILAKTAANSLVLVVPFLAAIVLSLILLELQGSPLASAAGAWTSIGLAVLIAVLFIGAFFNLGLLVSALTKQAVTALVTLLLAWVFLYGVYPRLASAAAQVVHPVKSEARLALEKAQIRANIEKARDVELDKLAKAMPDHEESPAYEEGKKKQQDVLDKYRTELEASWQALERESDARRASLLTLTADIARLSPVSSLVRPLAELSRTGWLEYRQFGTEAREFEGILNRDIFDKLKFIRMKAGGSTNFDEEAAKAAAPVFQHRPAPIETVIRNVLPDLVLLVLFNLVFFAGAFIVFIRYDAR
jgi:ABC-type transport system involved in multi-copper enzyme maturation permease subunit